MRAPVMVLTRKKSCLPLILAGTLALPALLYASPESRALIRQGAADFKERKYEEALKKFAGAAKADEKDPEAFFFWGAILNRFGRHGEALQRLARASAMGSKRPGLAFEIGWSFVGLGLWQEAVAQLEKFEKALPGRGQTSGFLGLSYLALGELDKAEAKFKEALERDPSLKPTVLLYLAAIEYRRKNPEAAEKHLEAHLKEAPESAISQDLKKKIEELSRAEKGGQK